jgi:hypothetical protein
MSETRPPAPLSPDRRVESVGDTHRLLEASLQQPAATVLLLESDLGPGFFDLRTGLAGDLLQKFVNFRIPLAIVVEEPGGHGERFRELAREHRTHPLARFFTSELEARTWRGEKHKELAIQEPEAR